MKLARAIASGVAGIVLVVAAIRFSFLNWILDGPGWLVGRFTSVNFHEGEGAFGLFLGMFLAWLTCTAAAWLVIYVLQKMATRKIKEGART